MDLIKPEVGLFLRSGRRIRGPLTMDRLLQLRDSGRLSRTDSVSVDRQTWVTADSIPELFEPLPTADAAPPEAWHYEKDGERIGPVSSDELMAAGQSGIFLPDDRVWCEGMKSWRPAYKVRELRNCFDPVLLATAGAQDRRKMMLAGGAIAATCVTGLAFAFRSDSGEPVDGSDDPSITVNPDGTHELKDTPCLVCGGTGKTSTDCDQCSGFGTTSCTNNWTTTSSLGPLKFTDHYVCRAGDIYRDDELTIHDCDVCDGTGKVQCSRCKGQRKLEDSCKSCGGIGTIRS